MIRAPCLSEELSLCLWKVEELLRQADRDQLLCTTRSSMTANVSHLSVSEKCKLGSRAERRVSFPDSGMDVASPVQRPIDMAQWT